MPRLIPKPPPKGKKRVTLSVDFVVDIDEDVEPNDVTFEIPLEKMIPMDCNGSGRKRVGRVRSYTTQEYFENPE
jgi:hypothetical protein